MTHHADDAISIGTGMLLSVAASAGGWGGLDQVKHGAAVLVFGVVGGVGGWLGKKLMDKLTRKKRSNNNNNNDR